MYVVGGEEGLEDDGLRGGGVGGLVRWPATEARSGLLFSTSNVYQRFPEVRDLSCIKATPKQITSEKHIKVYGKTKSQKFGIKNIQRHTFRRQRKGSELRRVNWNDIQ